MIPADLERAFKKMPASVRHTIRRQCDGDWSRVVVDHDGVTVYNNRAQAERARSRTTTPAARSSSPVVKPRAKIDPPPPPVAAPQPEPEPEAKREPTLAEAAAALKAHFAAHPPSRRDLTVVEPPVALQRPSRPSPAAMPVVRQPVTRQPQPTPRRPPVYTPMVMAPTPGEVLAPPLPKDDSALGYDEIPGTPDPTFDMSTLPDVGDTANTFATAYRQGLPPVIGFQWLWRVKELRGVSLDVVISALRNPQQVTVRPESQDKGYPVLKFTRGDVDVIVGFRMPRLPMVIACYTASRLDANAIPGMVNRTGGGGSREKDSSAPKDGRALANKLRKYGVTITPDDKEERALLSYQGQDIGHITLNTVDKNTVLNDWSRARRRITGIDKKMKAEAP